MEDTWSVEIWGVRGAAPAAYRDFLEYGGNTSCISVDCCGEAVIFDAGTGLLELGRHLRKKGTKRVHILLSHLHMDHICGLYGFPLFLDAGAEIHLYGGAEEGRLRERLGAALGRPYWPYDATAFSARVEVHEILPESVFRIKRGKEGDKAELTVRTLAGNHPGGSLLYRLEEGERSIVYGLDCETDGRMSAALQAFARDGKLLIWDANFTDEDLGRCAGWGYSSWRQGMELGRAAGAGLVLMTHYSREYTDCFLRGQQELAEREDDICRFAKEGMVIRI